MILSLPRNMLSNPFKYGKVEKQLVRKNIFITAVAFTALVLLAKVVKDNYSDIKSLTEEQFKKLTFKKAELLQYVVEKNILTEALALGIVFSAFSAFSSFSEGFKAIAEPTVHLFLRPFSDHRFNPADCLEEIKLEDLGSTPPILPNTSRSQELYRLNDFLEPSRGNFFIALTGETGSGKTTFFKQYVRALKEGNVKVPVFRLNIDAFRKKGFDEGLGVRLKLLNEYLLSFALLNGFKGKKFILFVDELVTLDSRDSGGDTLNNHIKLLMESKFPAVFTIVGATTTEELNKMYLEDPAMQGRIRNFELDPLSEIEIKSILMQQSKMQGSEYDMVIKRFKEKSLPPSQWLREAKRLKTQADNVGTSLSLELSINFPIREIDNRA
ncbi:hypothetical protein AB751O23_AC_00290 [Chlamydiales bacterium SCGC AB-751-O23]|jgi:hypothetical protein|nr:hypothetical protein AB751O23_AC_00290 [Chlamydiales bacterium SCGC AB-751-O23]